MVSLSLEGLKSLVDVALGAMVTSGIGSAGEMVELNALRISQPKQFCVSVP